MQALVDTNFFESYIEHNLYDKLKLNVERRPSAITMASTIDVTKNLCSDMILGLDFMKLHDEVDSNYMVRKTFSVDDNSNAMSWQQKLNH